MTATLTEPPIILKPAGASTAFRPPAVDPSFVPSPPAPRRYTFDEWLALGAENGSFDLVDGLLEERHVSNLSSDVKTELLFQVRSYAGRGRLGRAYATDSIFRCFPWKSPDNGRRPDFAFISLTRLPEDWATTNYYKIAPDLVAEVLSPNDLVYDVNEKLFEYLRAGVRLVWIIDPEQRVVFVHRLNGSSETLREADELSGEDVIPGFRCRVADLFPQWPVASADPAQAAPAPAGDGSPS